VHPGLFSFHAPTQARWAEAHLLSLREAEVVLAIAGMKGTYQAGLAAIVAKKKLIPVACFGGDSEKLSASTCGARRDSTRERSTTFEWSVWLRVKDWLREKAKITEIVVMGQEFGGGKTLQRSVKCWRPTWTRR